jgi:hypothetical protein
MKKKYLVVLMMFGMILAGCSRENSTPFTGAYGSAALSGQVTMSGTSDLSPRGVRVSVRGTGLSTVLGAAGEFAFVDVPAGAILDFSRETDGVAASLEIKDASSFVAVELAQTTAQRTGSSRRRGVGRSVEPVYEIEGTVVSATAEQLVVLSQRQGEQTIALTAETVIRKGKTTVLPEELVPGVRVHVKAKKVADALTAVLVIVQNTNTGEDKPPMAREYEGTVVSVSATQLVILSSKKVEETFVLDAMTVIRKGNTPVLATDIQVGWRVHVKASTSADGLTKTATLVIVQNTKDDDGDDDADDEVSVSGTVASVGTTSFTVTTAAGPVTVQVNSATKIRKRNATLTLADLTVGTAVQVEGTRVDATTVLAKMVKVS